MFVTVAMWSVPKFRGQGVAAIMCEHSQQEADSLRLGFVEPCRLQHLVALLITNQRQPSRLWQKGYGLSAGPVPGTVTKSQDADFKSIFTEHLAYFRDCG